MPYTDRNAVLSQTSASELPGFLDDDGDGVEDTGLLDIIIAACSRDVDGRLAAIYSTPFPDPAPSKVQAATLIFVCEALFQRRLTGDMVNPFRTRANAWREELDKIGSGDVQLDARNPRVVPQLDVIVEQNYFVGRSL